MQEPDKKENLKKLREFHKEVMDSVGVSEMMLIGKLAYRPSGKQDKYVSFFHSEISKGHDVFLEFTDRYNVPEDLDRTLYQWRFNPHFEEEYEKIDDTSKKNVRYLIPVDEFKVVKRYSQEVLINEPTLVKKETVKPETEKETPIDEFSLLNPATDPPLNEMTIRDLAAIMLKKPVSNKEWLNNIITKA